MSDPLIDTPTWEAPIRSFFNDIDVNHMRSVNGLDLADYATVKDNASAIYSVVSSGRMPLPPSAKWTSEMQEIFNKWIEIGCPKSLSDSSVS